MNTIEITSSGMFVMLKQKYVTMTNVAMGIWMKWKGIQQVIEVQYKGIYFVREMHCLTSPIGYR